MNIKPYFHNAKYYETDQMSIIHHSNYIRWFEEARIDCLEQMGIPYDEMWVYIEPITHRAGFLSVSFSLILC